MSANAPAWTERPHSGFELETGGMSFAITDQRDRNCGWCWHVRGPTLYGSDTLEQGGGCSTADDAKRAAIEWAQDFCRKTLAGITAPPTRGGPTEQFPNAPYCKLDQSCCDFVCGN